MFGSDTVKSRSPTLCFSGVKCQKYLGKVKVNLEKKDKLTRKPGKDLEICFQKIQPTLYGHMERSDKWINHCAHLVVGGCTGSERPPTHGK